MARVAHGGLAFLASGCSVTMQLNFVIKVFDVTNHFRFAVLYYHKSFAYFWTYTLKRSNV